MTDHKKLTHWSQPFDRAADKPKDKQRKNRLYPMCSDTRGVGTTTRLALELIARCIGIPNTWHKATDHVQTQAADAALVGVCRTHVAAMGLKFFQFRSGKDGSPAVRCNIFED